MKSEFQDFNTAVSEPSRGKLMSFLKIGKKEHLEQLRSGKLRFRSLDYFRSDETLEDACHDSDEGIDAIHQGKEVNVMLKLLDGEERTLTAETGLVDVKIRYHNEVFLFCFYALHTGVWPKDTIEEEEVPLFQQTLQVPESMDRHGDHVWVIMNRTAFRERLFQALQRSNIQIKDGFVKYVDYSQVNGALSEENRGFVKSIAFSDEREYRFQLWHESLVDPFILDVGDLSDISLVLPLDEFRKSLVIELKQPVNEEGSI